MRAMQSPGRITDPIYGKRVTRLVVLWGFASRSENEDGLHEREGCPREPDSVVRREPVATDAPCSCCGEPSPGRRRGAACVLVEQRGSVRGLKGPTTGRHPLRGSEPPSWRTPSIWVTASPTECDSPLILADCSLHGFESAKGICYCLPVVLLQDPPQGGTKRIQSALWEWQPWPGVLQLCEGLTSEDGWAKRTLTMAPEPQPWASSHQGPHVRKM